MEIILTEDIAGLGDIGEQVNVKPGYARNFLIPQGLAIESGSKNGRALAHRMKQLAAKKLLLKGAALEKGNALKQVKVELSLKVGEHDKVFGAIHSKDIAEALKVLGYEVDRRRVMLIEPIKKIGLHTVKIKLHSEVFAEVEVQVLGVSAQEGDVAKAAAKLKEKMEMEDNKEKKKRGKKDA
ncbi:MAG: 50S ribosomal protein L9 [Deltaproteobacteria bacterium]|jgi:large subunit ribosomal protein L9|nr:50S ribosomal protein L9 [Deltaproteobacteria bacterium]